MKISSDVRSSRRSGFTLVELLVVIAISGVLAVVAFYFARSGLNKAAASKSLSNIRQSGMVLLTHSQDMNGKLQYYGGGGSAGFDVRVYNIVRNTLGLNISGGTGNKGELCDIMHWNPTKLKPVNYHWNCFAVNFTNVPDFNVAWANENLTSPTAYSVRTLIPSVVTRPEAYPLLITSSTSTGDEIFRILESNGDLVGLRSSGKALASMLDGSAREMDPTDLKKAGFTRAYDNSKTPPKLRTL